jgi:hypothetical protein
MIIEQLRSVTVIVVMAHCAFIAGAAEAPPPQKSAPQSPADKPLSASLGVVVYPAKQQDAAKQSQDEFECYNWAKGSTGYDPMNPPKQEPVVAETPKGGRVRGALRGAAAGAAIGEVASNDADKGAEVGAVAGVLRGGQQQRHAQAAAQEQAQAQAEASRKQQLDGFKKGFSACLQGRGYSAVM